MGEKNSQLLTARISLGTSVIEIKARSGIVMYTYVIS